MVSVYSLMRKIWRERNEELIKNLRKRAIEWRKEKSIVRVDRPLRLDRARSLGYKAKQGFIVVRVRVRKGGFSKPRPRSGRRPKALGVIKHKVNVSLKEEAINRVSKKYVNMHVLGAYELFRDAKYAWYEVILVDPNHPSIKSSRNISLPKKL
ncbi:MAG: 50S ribosomal protein L15e [Nitrososphaerota archaeon]